MKRLLPRPPRRRAKDPQGTPEAAADGVQPTEVRPTAPAGAEPADPAAPSPTFRNRGRLRRRMRYLRRVRELGYRDLGGLVFDQHRFERQDADLVRAKVAALAAVDTELRTLETVLKERRDVAELREPGLSACARCGTLHGSDARFCPSCGLSLTGARAIAADVGEGQHVPRPQLPAPVGPGSDGGRNDEAAPDTGRGDGRGGAEEPTAIARPGADRVDG